MPLNDSGLSLNQPSKISSNSILKSEQSMVNYDEDYMLPTLGDNEQKLQKSHEIFNAMNFQECKDQQKPNRNTKELLMKSHQENAFKNIMMASSKLQTIKKFENIHPTSETIKVKEKKRSFMDRLLVGNSSGITSRIFEGGDSRQKVQSSNQSPSGNSKINETNTFNTNQLISNQMPQDDYQSSQFAPNKFPSNKQSSNFPLNSQEFDKIILDQDPNSLNPYINGSSLKKQFKQEKDIKKMLQIGQKESSVDFNDRAEAKSVKNTNDCNQVGGNDGDNTLKKVNISKQKYKRHQSILLPQNTTIIEQDRGGMNGSQGGRLKTDQDEKYDKYEKKGSNSFHKSRHSCSQSLSSNMMFRTQQKFLSKRSDCDSISMTHKFGTTMQKGKLGQSHMYQQSFNYETFNQNLEKMQAEQFVIQDTDNSNSQVPMGLQRKSIIGMRRKLAKKKKKNGIYATNRPLTDFNIYQSIIHENGPDQQKSRRIGRHLRHITQDEDDQNTQPASHRHRYVKPEQRLYNIVTSASLVRKSGRQQVPKILKEQSNKHIRNKTILQSFMFKTKVKQFKEDIKETFSDPLKKRKKEQKSNLENEQIDSDDYMKAFDDMEVDPELLRERKNDEEGIFLIQPDSLYRAAWDISLFLCIIYQSISLPARISFEVKFSEFLFILEIIIDVMFILDIFLNFNTGIFIKTRLIMNRYKIATDYLGWWFWIDLVSSLPLTWILAWSQGMTLRQVESDDQMSQMDDSNSNINSSVMADAPGLLKLLKVSKLLKMLKLLRVAKLKKIMNKFEEYIVTDSMDLMVTFFNITVQIMFIAHYMGCFFYYKGMDSLRVNNDGWLISEDMLDTDIWESYITAIYWAFTTMSAVGYGDITPVTTDEQRYTMIAMVLSCGIFAYTINSISNIVSRFNKNSGVYKEKMMYVNQFLKSKDMPQETRMKVRRYLDYVFQQKKEIKIEEADVYKILNESLRDQVQLIIKGRIVNKVLFLENFGLDFLSELTMKIEQTSYIQDDFIFMEKDKAECMYFIITGKVAMIHKQSSTFITDLGNEEYFGEYGLLKDENRCLSAKCRDFTEAYVITKKDFEDVSENCIEAVRSIRLIKDGLDNDNLKHMKIKCYICKKTDHLALRCPKFPKWRGNLMRMLMQQQNEENEANETNEEKEQNKIDDEEDNHKRPKFFIYAEEAHEPKIQVSEESDETLKIKTNLIRYNVKEMMQLDGKLISSFFECPEYAHQHGFCDVLSSSPLKMNSMMTTSSVYRKRLPIQNGINEPMENMLMINQDGLYGPDSPEFPGRLSKPYLEDSLNLTSVTHHSLQQNISPNRPQQIDRPSQQKNQYIHKSFKLPKIPEEQDNQDNSQGDSQSVQNEQEKLYGQIKEITQKRLHSSNSSMEDDSSVSAMTSSLNTSQNTNSKKNSWENVEKHEQDRDQFTPALKKESALDFIKKDEYIIDLSAGKQNQEQPLSHQIENLASNSFKLQKRNSSKKINIINNQEITTERTGFKKNVQQQSEQFIQVKEKTLQQLQQRRNLQQLQKELTINSRNSKSKGSHVSGNRKRGGTGGKKRMARSNGKRRRGSTASRLEQSFDAYNHELTQTGLQIKKLNSNTSKSKSQWAKLRSEGQQNDIQRSKIRSGDDSKQKDQQHIFTNSVSLSKQISVIEEEKNNMEKDETYLEDTPNHQKREQRSEQKAKRQNQSFINEVINSPLADIKSSMKGFNLLGSPIGQGLQIGEKKNIMKNRPIIDSELFQIKNKMGHTHKLSKQLVNEIKGLISPKSNLTISSLNQN